jgi:hypothetical protein
MRVLISDWKANYDHRRRHCALGGDELEANWRRVVGHERPLTIDPLP